MILPRTLKTRAGLDAFLARMAPSRAIHVITLHDDVKGCTPGACKCSPWYRVEELTDEGYATAQEAQAAWASTPDR